MNMNSRERVRIALTHQEPDRVPMDLGSTAVSTIHRTSYLRLLDFLGLPALNSPAMISESFQTVEISEQVRAQLGVDLLGLRQKAPEGRQNIIQPTDDSFTDEWGVRFKRTGDATGTHFPVGHPLLDADLSAIKKYCLPNLSQPSRVAGLGDLAHKLYHETNYALVADGMWSLLQKAYDLRGMDSFMIDMATNEVFARTLLDRLAETILANIALFLKEVGAYVEVVTVADDLGTQTGPLMSLTMYRNLLKPYHKLIVKEIKKYTPAKIMLHTDGSIYKFLEDLIDVEFDIINPIQASAKNMDTQILKKEFGQVLSFWGGVDTQDILPYGSVAAVEREVRQRIDDLAPGGGYVLGAVHVIQNDVPPENILGLFNTGAKYGRYEI